MKSRFRPNIWVFFVLSFTLTIFAGMGALLLPGVYQPGGLSLIDAFFMSTSAVCVTGLACVKMSNFSMFGQTVFIVLMQIGGIGVMTLSSTLMLFLRGDLSLDKRVTASKLTGTFSLHEARLVLPAIVMWTILCELLGALVLGVGFIIEHHPVAEGIYLGVFHSVAAFCNAGFSTFDANMIGMNPLVKTTIMLLIIMGGLGYPVAMDLYLAYYERRRVRLHTKVVVLTSLLLIFFGAVGIYAFECEGMSVMDSFFQSVTARTAGFNSVDIGKMRETSICVMLFLMFVGASPASTGGGVKTSTFAVAVAFCFKIIRGGEHFVLFRRSFPAVELLKAFALIFAYLAVLGASTVLLLLVQNLRFLDALFEVTSALGTVGLTLGITEQLNTLAKLVIINCMFIGRIGPAALILTMVTHERHVRIEYPEEKVILG